MLALLLGLTLMPSGVAWAEETADPPVVGEAPETNAPEAGAPKGVDPQTTELPQGGEGAAETAPAEEPLASPARDLFAPSTAATPAQAPATADPDDELPSISMKLSRYRSGTDPFTPGDNSAGNDASSTNDIVRVNDTVVYKVEYSVSKSDAENLTWSVALPKGMEILEMPGYCKATGSSLLPAAAGTPRCR
ncbi:hypothetical protein G7066_12045 [Leucobacter coleopterorum]|uniref:Uncharacterized protein n=1 Tax=Leucobacter coleopterorum TaxID=2714933 RepID=A0ABX6JY11_9MICO|nr:hypothetical protein [Leucobacter coleopterorum]QIM19113.1 hypothetical protein G7066_12045 [Leucobacter coleopterorum]